jgi:hypothetical protein
MTRLEWKKAWCGGSWINPTRRLAIYLRDHFVCQLCGRDLHDADPSDVTLDHSRPRCQGGSHEATNLFTCCKSCNCSRKQMSVIAYLRKRFAEITAGTTMLTNRQLDRAAKSKRQSVTDQMRKPITNQLTLARSIISGEINRTEAIINHRSKQS